MDTTDRNFVEVYRARNLPEAHTIRIALEEAGIAAQIEGELLQGVVGDLPLGWPTAPRILVEEAQAAAARAIIRQHEHPEADDADDEPDEVDDITRCLSCGQAMDERELQCPKCGWSFGGEQPAKSDEQPSRDSRSDRVVAASRYRGIIIFLCALVVIGAAFVIWYKPDTAHDFERGVKASEQKDYDLAIACFTRVIRWNPKDPAAYFHRAIAHGDKGEFDQAIADYSAVLRLQPYNSSAYIARGNSHFDKGEYDRAIADYGQAMQLAPSDPLPRLNRGLSYAKKGEYERAVADLFEASRLAPNDQFSPVNRALVYNSLAWVYATCPADRIRDGKKALELASKACELSDWKVANFLDTLAAAHAEVGQFEEAVKWQQKALDSPDYLQDYPDRENELDQARARLKLYQDGKPYREE